MDRGGWWATAHGVAKSQTGLGIRQKHSSVFCNICLLDSVVNFDILFPFSFFGLILKILIH